MKLEDLENFSASLHDKKIVARSQARILSGSAFIYRFLVLDGYIKDDPTELLPSPQIGQHLPEYLSVEEVDALEGAIRLIQMGRTAQQGDYRNALLLWTSGF